MGWKWEGSSTGIQEQHEESFMAIKVFCLDCIHIPYLGCDIVLLFLSANWVHNTWYLFVVCLITACELSQHTWFNFF